MIGFIFDIDGVLTDGKIWIDNTGNYSKNINMKDIDAIYELQRSGFGIYAISAEKNEFTKWVKKRFPWDMFYEGCIEKADIVRAIRSKECEYVVYIGDGKNDLSAFDEADYSACPRDAIEEAREKVDYILEDTAGSGCLWGLLKLSRLMKLRNRFDGTNIWKNNLKEHQEVFKALYDDDEYQKSFLKAANILSNAFFSKKRAVIFGNGGSASDAQHIAAEFVGKYKCADLQFDMEALNVNSSIITAIGNDFKYEDIFARQITCMLKKGDVAIGLSTSGKSANVINALDIAKSLGIYTILITGRNKEKYLYDAVLKVPSVDTPRIQEMHILTGHSLAEYVELAYINRDNIIP